MASMTSTVEGLSRAGEPGRTMQATGRGFLTRIVRCPAVTGGLLLGAGPRRRHNRSIGPVLAVPRRAVAVWAQLPRRRDRPRRREARPPSGLAIGDFSRKVRVAITARSGAPSRGFRPGNRATTATPAWERNERNPRAVEERRPGDRPRRLVAAGGDRK
jgi:hypothetical protein